MTASWDLQSTGFSWLLAAVGVALAVTAANACHSHASLASVYLLAAALTTVQHLGFAATCFASQSWLVTSVHAPRQGPGQQEPRIRKGSPGVKSPGGIVGLDGWSVLAVSVVGLPILVSLLALHQPSEHLQWRTNSLFSIGATAAENFNDNGASWYTTGAYESITMSLRASVTVQGAVTMSNTADIAVDAANKRIIMPSRVEPACKHEEVAAKRLKALLGTYGCSRINQPQPPCEDPTTNATTQDSLCVDLRNATKDRPVPQQFMKAQHLDMLVNCNVTYSVATVDVMWRGADERRARLCQIAAITVYEDVPEDKAVPLTAQDLTGSMSLLTLPLVNAFRYMVSHERIVRSSDGDVELFYGSIFAAATTIRSISDKFDPTKQPGQPIQVRYSVAACQRYGWTWVIIWLLVANVALAVVCTTICVATQKLADVSQEGFGAFLCWRCLPSTKLPAGNGGAPQPSASLQHNSSQHTTATAPPSIVIQAADRSDGHDAPSPPRFGSPFTAAVTSANS